jgi:hypothetical protein
VFTFSLSNVGGTLKLNLILVYGLITFPPSSTEGNPSYPIQINYGFQSLPNKHYKGLFLNFIKYTLIL